jgi:epsilon-lactone hydrolase
MTMSSAERKIRRRALPLTRFFQAYMPLAIADRGLKLGTAQVRLPSGITRESVSADGVPCDWLIPDGSPRNQALLYLHGGGFVYGQTPPHLQMVAYLAGKMGVRALLVDYRVAPKYPYPAALDDCVTAYHWLRGQGFLPGSIVVAGDSAGGNLTLTTLMKLRDGGEPLPAAAACLSPVGDMSDRAGDARDFKDPLLHPKATRRFHTAYVGQRDPHDPLMSPLFGDWHGLPPLLVHAGEDEFLKEDAIRIEEAARAAGVEVRLEIFPHMWHVWQIFLDLPEAKQSLDDIAGFFKSHLANASK